MSSVTPNFGFILPSINDPTDQDLWGGMLNSNFTLLDNILGDFEDKLPVGSLYFNADVATNPATLLGYGTWLAFGAGRVIVGVGTGTDANGVMETFANGDTGGEYEHTLTDAEMPAHYHLQSNHGNFDARYGLENGLSNVVADYSSAGSGTNAAKTSTEGGGGPHNNLQPYITVYVWRRSA